jgi:hypothetical protein
MLLQLQVRPEKQLAKTRVQKQERVDGIDGKRLVFSKPMRKLNHQVVSMDDTA